jgi:hypothetical protein
MPYPFLPGLLPFPQLLTPSAGAGAGALCVCRPPSARAGAVVVVVAGVPEATLVTTPPLLPLCRLEQGLAFIVASLCSVLPIVALIHLLALALVFAVFLFEFAPVIPMPLLAVNPVRTPALATLPPLLLPARFSRCSRNAHCSAQAIAATRPLLCCR